MIKSTDRSTGKVIWSFDPGDMCLFIEWTTSQGWVLGGWLAEPWWKKSNSTNVTDTKTTIELLNDFMGTDFMQAKMINMSVTLSPSESAEEPISQTNKEISNEDFNSLLDGTD